MKKFKKSAVVIPALARIAVTAAASVSGTVAWFTANRAVSVSGNNFVAAKLDSSLDVVLTGRVGTQATQGSKGINMNANDKLTHGSYHAKAITKTDEGHLYVANLTDGGDDILNYTDYGPESTARTTTPTSGKNKWCARYSENGNTWYGVSWQRKFTLTQNVDNRNSYLLFDVNGSSFTDTDQNNQGKQTTLSGFRIAFRTDVKFLVVGGDSTDTHTTGTLSTSQGHFGTNYTPITSDTAKFLDNDSNLTSSNLNLGQFTSANNNQITITCVAWYEGSDDYVKDKIGESEISMSSTKINLNFYTRYISAE